MAMSTPRFFGVSARVSRIALRMLARLHDVRGAQLPRRFHLAVVLDDGDDFAAGQRGDVQNHQPQRAAADDGDDIAGMRVANLQSHARRRPAAQ